MGNAAGNSSNPDIMRARINKGGAGLKYPPDVDQQPTFFSINLREYSANPFSGQGDWGGKGGEYYHLPVPTRGLQDSFDIKYKSQTMGAIGGIGSSISDFINDPFSIAGNALSGVGSLARNIGESFAGALGDVVGQGDAAAAGVQELTGQIDNPNLAALFEGVNLREFTFSWKMIAYDREETDQIDQMVTKLKKGALPTRQLGGNFTLEYPKIAYLYLSGPKNGNLLTFSVKGSFIKNITVNYGGQSHPAFFVGSNSPVEVDLSMTFIERSIVTSDDIAG
jgi:hypothetical protein